MRKLRAIEELVKAGDSLHMASILCSLERETAPWRVPEVMVSHIVAAQEAVQAAIKAAGDSNGGEA